MGEYSCPQCHKPIYDDDALLCHFCGGSLNRASKDVIGKMRYGNMAAWVLVVVIVLFGFVMLVIR